MSNKVDQVHQLCPDNIITLKVLTPYPGTKVYQFFPKELRPKCTEDWIPFTRTKCNNPWTEKKRRVELMCIAQQFALSKGKGIRKLFSIFEKFRWRYRFFSLPIEPIILTDILGYE